MELLLIRHAAPARLEVASGLADPSLTDAGRTQALALAATLTEDEGQIHAIYTSPLRRARETAAPLASALGLEPRVEADLAEWDRDSLAYIPMEELKATGHEVWRAMAEGRFADLGIDVDAFAARVVRRIDAVAARHPSQRVAVVCHGGVINVYTAAVLGLDQMLYFEPDYTSVSRVLVSQSGARSLRSLNETGHLRPRPEPTARR